MTNHFSEKILEELPIGKRIIKFKSATVNGNFLIVDFLAQSENFDSVLSNELRLKIKDIAVSLLPSDVNLKINYIKSSPSKENIVKKIIEYIFEEHKSLYSFFSKAEYKMDIDDIIYISVVLEKYLCDYARGIGLSEKINAYLDLQFYETIEIAFIETANKDAGRITITVPNVSDIRIIDAKPINVYIKGALSYPRYIKDIINTEKEINNLTLCGIISNIKMRKIIKETAKIKEKEFYTFILNDTTERIKCKFFARIKNDFEWGSVITDNAALIMNGSYKYDNFDNRFCFYVNAIATADINFNSINLISDFNKDMGKYLAVLPEPYNDMEQNYIFDLLSESENYDKNTYCVFDLETTGLGIDSDEIIEIAAIKIENGKFTEKFSSFVKPSEKIPTKITEITGITDNMVADAPSPSDVIADFYRFSNGCILVGHNIATFDIPFLNAQAFKYKYKFENIYEDTLILAKQKLKLSRNKLSDVCNALNIPLIGAHRAINDVIANAKVFLKLKKM